MLLILLLLLLLMPLMLLSIRRDIVQDKEVLFGLIVIVAKNIDTSRYTQHSISCEKTCRLLECTSVYQGGWLASFEISWNNVCALLGIPSLVSVIAPNLRTRTHVIILYLVRVRAWAAKTLKTSQANIAVLRSFCRVRT